MVAVKVIKSTGDNAQHALREIRILETMQKYAEETGTSNSNNIIYALDYFRISRNTQSPAAFQTSHICIVFELIGHDLYQFIKDTNHFQGMKKKASSLDFMSVSFFLQV